MPLGFCDAAGLSCAAASTIASGGCSSLGAAVACPAVGKTRSAKKVLVMSEHLSGGVIVPFWWSSDARKSQSCGAGGRNRF